MGAPWLAHGNLSPRYVASECRKYEKVAHIRKKSQRVVGWPYRVSTSRCKHERTKSKWYYDQHGDYVRHWLPELKNVPTLYVHEPWKMNQSQQKEFACRLGVDYPNPIVKPFENSRGGGDRGKGGRSGR